MDAYQKEKRKILLLLGVGFVLLILFIFGVLNEYGLRGISDSMSDFGTWFIFLLIMCYPLGIVYGWRQMLGMTSFDNPETGPATRYYTVLERNIFKNSIIMSWVFKMGLLIAFGWIIGTYNALCKLRNLKK